jgi:ribosome biogenesis protein Nip4
VEKQEGKKPVEKLRLRWDDNIKIGLREIGRSVTDFIGLAQVRDQWRAFVNMVSNIRVT